MILPEVDSDPVPGDPDAAETLARRLERIGDKAEQSERILRALRDDSSSGVWEGPAARAFAPHVKKLPSRLKKVAVSYHAAADALRTYAREHTEAKKDGKEAAKRANAAVADLQTAQAVARAAAQRAAAEAAVTGTPLLPPPADTASADAVGRYHRAVEDVERAKERRERAGKRAADALDDAAERGTGRRKHKVLAWIRKHAGSIKKIAKWAERIGLAVLIVVVVIAVAVVAVVVVVALLGAAGFVGAGLVLASLAAVVAGSTVAAVVLATAALVGLTAAVVKLVGDVALHQADEGVTVQEIVWDVVDVGTVGVGKIVKIAHKSWLTWRANRAVGDAETAAKTAEDAAEAARAAEAAASARAARAAARLRELTSTLSDVRWYQLLRRAWTTGNAAEVNRLVLERQAEWTRAERALAGAVGAADKAHHAERVARLRAESRSIQRSLEDLRAYRVGEVLDSERLQLMLKAEQKLLEQLTEPAEADQREKAHV